MRRPKIECDCYICSDDTITICLDEAHRLLQINYDDVETVEVGDGGPRNERDPQRTLGDF